MRSTLHDLRILKLAEMYETAYESFVLRTARNLLSEDLSKRAFDELANGHHAERIGAEVERLSQDLDEQDRADLVRAALMDLVEIERAAQDSFRSKADAVHDGRVAALFRALADEEAEHVRVANDLLHSVEVELRSGEGQPDPFRVAAFLVLDEPAGGPTL